MAFKKPAHADLRYVQGDIVHDEAEVLVNTVNCQLSSAGNGVMGKGVALAFKTAFPSIMKDYEAAIRSGEMVPGRALLFDLPDGRKWAALGTKDHFSQPSKAEWVDKGLQELGQKLRQGGYKSVALPPPGCGNGQLKWGDIEPLVHKHLEGVSVSLYAAPSGAMTNLIERRSEAENLAEDVRRRDERIAKPLYGTLVAKPEVLHVGMGGDAQVIAQMQIQEHADRKPVLVELATGKLSSGDRDIACRDLAELEPGAKVSLGGKWKRGAAGWQFAAARIATGQVPLSGMKSDKPSPFLIADPQIKRFSGSELKGEALLNPAPAPGKAGRSEKPATMYFTYGARANDDLKARGPAYSTFEAILDGKRTSTTRYDSWRGSDKWADMKAGDRVRFFEDKGMDGRSVVVEVMDVLRVDHRKSSVEAIDRWSRAEGWSADVAREKREPGWQIRYLPVPGQPILQDREAGRLSVRMNAIGQIKSDREHHDRMQVAAERHAEVRTANAGQANLAAALMAQSQGR